MAAPKQSTEIRRAQILRAASDIVAREGVAALEVSAIARRCGLVPSALYRHVRSKDDVLDALVGTLGARLRENVASARSTSSRAIERLGRLFDLHLDMARGRAPIPRLVFSEEVLGGPPARRRKVLDALSSYLAAVAKLVEEGVRAGDVRADADPAAVAGLFLGAVQHTAVLALMGGAAFNRAAHAARVRRTLLALLSPDPRPAYRGGCSRTRRPRRHP
ncbi:MAG: TetR/AcrR family transcriptional regulator [Planctomycetia bacterium]|nr:TetR/AcrR family transcriptional regulator [Planctomycetia bacterium]